VKAKLWTGRIITALTVLFLIFDGVTKLLQVSQVKEGMATLGYGVVIARVIAMSGGIGS
jgi:hypothetical protein